MQDFSYKGYKGYKYGNEYEAFMASRSKQMEYNTIRKKALFKKNLKQKIAQLFTEKDEVLELLRIVKDRLEKLEMQDSPTGLDRNNNEVVPTSSFSCDPGSPLIVYPNPTAPLILELVG